MAVVNRGDASIATLAGAALHNKVYEVKDNDDTHDEKHEIAVTNEEAEATQAGVCQAGHDAKVLQYQKDRGCPRRKI